MQFGQMPAMTRGVSVVVALLTASAGTPRDAVGVNHFRESAMMVTRTIYGIYRTESKRFRLGMTPIASRGVPPLAVVAPALIRLHRSRRQSRQRAIGSSHKHNLLLVIVNCLFRNVY
jgi:hypothetical protein